MNKLENIKILTLKAITHIRSKNILKKLRFYEILFEMISKGIIRNKREIYYLDVPIFRSQKVVDNLIKDTCKELKDTPFGLNITNTLKGIYYGEVVFHNNGNEKNFTSDNTSNLPSGAILIPDMNKIDSVFTPHKLCLIVEKDTIFSKVLREIKPTTDILVVCGKGYPCRNTLQFLSKLNKNFINLIGLFDYDPYGLDIFLKYKAVCHIEMIGLKQEDLDLVPVEFHLELTERDKTRLKKLKETLSQAKNMNKMGVKIEMENVFDSINILDYIKRSKFEK